MQRALVWTGRLFGVVIFTLIVIGVVFVRMGETRLRRTYASHVEEVSLPNGEDALLEGQRIFRYRGCEACHGEQLQGLVYLDHPAIGQVITPNLTDGSGGIGSQRSDQDWVRAIRHGLQPDGTPLLFMPSTEFYFLSDADLGMVIAYIKSAPPVANEMPPSQLSITGRVVMNVTREITFLPAELIPHSAPRPAPPSPGITPEYGAYLALSCKVCHGLTLSGGDIPGFPQEWPPAPNLTFDPASRLPDWGVSGFIQVIRNGGKHGRWIDSDYMPWTSYRYMNDDELHAVYAYLESLPPTTFGNH